MRLVLSTRNEHKLLELSALMHPYELDPLPADVQLPPETGTTFAENALLKARLGRRARRRARGLVGSLRRRAAAAMRLRRRSLLLPPRSASSGPGGRAASSAATS